MERSGQVKIELYNDHFENAKRYNIPRAQLIIADIPYNLGNNAYASDPRWYNDGDNKNGESKLTEWEWGDYFTIYIENVVDFSAWLQERDVEPMDEETETWSWLRDLVEKYNEGREDE